VIALIPPLLDHPRVLGVGEIGLNKNTKNEITIFEEQVDLAAKYNQLILIHTPHLEDKHKGTSIITSILKNDPRIKPQRVLIDHCEEHTIRMARDAGFWAGLTIYPVSKVTPQRGTDILENFGPKMICVNSASDWGESSPCNLTDTSSRIPPPRAQRGRSHGNLFQQPLQVFRTKREVESSAHGRIRCKFKGERKGAIARRKTRRIQSKLSFFSSSRLPSRISRDFLFS